jgi:hypothetical protein
VTPNNNAKRHSARPSMALLPMIAHIFFAGAGGKPLALLLLSAAPP